MEILGVELGVSAVRGVIYDAERQEIVLAAECPLSGLATNASGALNDNVMIPALDDVLYKLGITSPATIQSGLTIGPPNGGVGSGPELYGWLAGKSKHIGEPITYAGNIGISFAPLGAVEDALRLASESGLVPDRIELAPVAAARVLGNEVEDVITIGSGRGWRARMRRFEILEAVIADDITADEPLRVITSEGHALEIDRYATVSIADSLNATSLLDLGQLAVCVGVAIGVANDSGGNLMVGQIIGDQSQGGDKAARRGPKKDRQPAADFFTRSPRPSTLDLTDGPDSDLDSDLESEVEAEQHRSVEELANESFGGTTTKVLASPNLADARRGDDPFNKSDPYIESYREAAEAPVDEVSVGEVSVGEVSVGEVSVGEVSVGEGSAVASSTGTKDPYVKNYENSFRVPAPAPAPTRGLAPVPPVFDETVEAPRPEPLETIDIGEPHPKPVNRWRNDPVTDIVLPPPVSERPSPPPVAKTATLPPPPSHRVERPAVVEGGLPPERPLSQRRPSRGTNQPELVSNDALLRQFSPEPNAENWSEESRIGLTLVITLLALSAIALLVLYLLL